MSVALRAARRAEDRANRPFRACVEVRYYHPVFVPRVVVTPLCSKSPTSLKRCSHAYQSRVQSGFGLQVQLWPMLDCKHKHKLFVSGGDQWEETASTWKVALLFTNLYTCCRGGSVQGGFTGIEPPNVPEYLLSTNAGVQMA